MPNDMSNYANRQSPNQQAKIASMMNAQRQGNALTMAPRPEFGKMQEAERGPTPAAPISQSLGRMQQAQPAPQYVPSQEYRGGNRGSASFTTDNTPNTQFKVDSTDPEANRRYKLASSDRIENQRAQEGLRDAAGGQAGGGWPEDQARHYAPYPIHHETGEPMVDPIGASQDYHEGMTAGSSFVPSGPPSPDSPGRGTQYGEDMAGRPEPEYTHNVANRQTPAQHIGGQYRGAENTYITLSGGEQQQYQQFGYIDINGIRYARGVNGEMMNMGGSPEFGTPGVTNPGQGY